MERQHITLVPAGGLGNRMKAIAAGVRLATDVGAAMDIVWFQDWGLGCRYDQLFRPLEESCTYRVREATAADLLLRDRPRRRNLRLPRLYEWARYDRCIEEAECTQLMQRGTDFAAICRGRRVWLSANVYFVSQDIPQDAFDLFRPVDHIAQRIHSEREAMGTDLVGVHIRRTDNQRSIEQSPTQLFIDRMRAEPDTTHFLLATDSEEEKVALRQVFGQRIHTSARQAERGTLQGMEDAVTEMYLLSQTRRILGSAASTYSMTAAALGRTPLEIIQKKASEQA